MTFHLGISCTVFVLICTVVVLYCFVMCVCVCVCVSVRVFWEYVYCTLTEAFLTLTEVFPCFSISCEAKCQGKIRLDGARSALFQISSYLCCSVVICVVPCIVCV